jgi:LmbE family N-acetylglucosaminyl deacetylase
VKQVYLSPHLDDAVLSCGAAIHRQATAGEAVRVITFFAGEVGADAPLSPFAQVQHGYWGHPPRPMALRRAEDMAALTLLGAEVCHLDYLDAVYRADASGQWLYTDLDTLLGSVHPRDPLALRGGMPLADHLAALIPADAEAVVYAPLGVGRHVDHQIVHRAARLLGARGYRLAFYEDYPYAERPGAVEAALVAAAAQGWSAETRAVDPPDLAAKVSAVGYYRSQLSVLFGGAELMPSRVWAFAAGRPEPDCLGERIWWPQ